MSNAIFPDLPGLLPTVTRAPQWKTEIKETPSGREYRGTFMSYPRYRYRLSFGFLRDTAAEPELSQLLGFFNARRGAFDTFLFVDPSDNVVVDQVIGVGDGVTTSFQLVRTYGGVIEPVYDPASGYTILVNGGASSYTLGALGLVTFVTAPPAGHEVTFTGSFYWRCRFVSDELPFEQFLAQFWAAKSVEFKTVPP